MTDPADSNPNMPDALEVAASRRTESSSRTGKLVGPLHGVVMAIKDQYDTFDMRTTSGADAQYANDRPPDDATFVKRLRDAGAIIIGQGKLAEYAVDGARSSFGGTFCNPYDTERSRECRAPDRRARSRRTWSHARSARRPLSRFAGRQRSITSWGSRPPGARQSQRDDGRRAEHPHRSDLPDCCGRGERYSMSSRATIPRMR